MARRSVLWPAMNEANELHDEKLMALADAAVQAPRKGTGCKAFQIRAAFDQREKAIEHEIDHKPLEMHLSLGVAYNFLTK
jgi:hypothetical protein